MASYAVARQASPTMNGLCYQIDFTAVAAGKRFATTKRRVRWRFGFVNKDAIESGQTGTSCRGEEHDITIVWSVTSGKRLILADGQEIHYSNNRTGVFTFSWTMRGNHVLKVVAHAAPAMTATPGFRQYDLFVDGQSFFHMPKVYELGIRAGGGPKEPPHAYANYQLTNSAGGNNLAAAAPNSEQEEDYDLQRAIRESLKDSQQHLEKKGKEPGNTQPSVQAVEVQPAPPPVPETKEPRESEVQDLLDFALEPMPSSGQNDIVDANPGNPANSSALPPYDPFTGQTSPSYSSVTSDVLAAYNQPTGATAPAPATAYTNAHGAYPQQPNQQAQMTSYDYQNGQGANYQQAFASPPPAANGQVYGDYSPAVSAVTDNTIDVHGVTNGSPRHNLQVDTNFEGEQQQQARQKEAPAMNGNNFETTFKNIVNLDDINSPASSPDSTNPFENTFKDPKQKDKLKKGAPQPPAYGWGPQKTLAEMKSMGTGHQVQVKAEVMRAPPQGITPNAHPQMAVPPPNQQQFPTPTGATQGALVAFSGQPNPSGVNNWAGGVMPPVQAGPPNPQANGYPPMGSQPQAGMGYGPTPTNGYVQQQPQQQQQQQQWGNQPQYAVQGGAPANQGYYQQQQYATQY